jgi:LPXTG-site transpeptidase (sortase) family protein
MHARRATVRHAFTALWAACLIAGLVLLGGFGIGMWNGFSQQQHLNQVWQTQPPPPATQAPTIDPSLKRPIKGVDFAIRVPKLNYFAAIKEGVDSGVLYASPGHYPRTPWPGDQGTVGVAAHNVYWIDFPKLKKGDEIDLETRYGVYRYHVVSTEVVNPDNRTALVADAPGYNLALTTCWPLWAGAFATQRYVIHAEQYWPAPPQSRVLTG